MLNAGTSCFAFQCCHAAPYFLVSSVQRVTECSMLNAGLPFIVVMQYYLVTGQLCVTHD